MVGLPCALQFAKTCCVGPQTRLVGQEYDFQRVVETCVTNVRLGTHLWYGGETWFGKPNIKIEGYAFPTVFIFRKRFQHVTQAPLSQQYGPKKYRYVNYQVQIRVFALPTTTTASGLRCCSKGTVSCPRSYQFWTLLSRHRTFMGKMDVGVKWFGCFAL
jgi:hypothetical protein